MYLVYLNLPRLPPQVRVSGLLSSRHRLIMAQVLHMDPGFPGAASIYLFFTNIALLIMKLF